jgi:hypothetical protein
MGKNFTDLKTALGDWLNLDANELSDSIRGDCINIALREICRLHDTRYNEVSDTFPTVATTFDYAVPATWSRPFTLWYIHPTNGGIVRLVFKTKDEFDQLFSDTAKTGLPSHYTLWGSNIRLGKTPDRAITINRNFYAILADLSAGNLTNGFTDNAWEALLFNALAEASEFGIEDARIPMWRQRGQKFVADLVIEQARAKSVGRRATGMEPH